MLSLTEKLFLGKGRERKTYIHPIDKTKVVKITYDKSLKFNQNEMEYNYFQYLKKNKTPMTHLTDCYGKISTNFGEGYIFDRVYDYNGCTSMSFENIILKGKISKENELSIIEELKNFIFNNKIVFVDTALSNILCQEYKKDKFKLIITDGIGGKRLGIKAKLYQYSSLFAIYKIYKQWYKIIHIYNRTIQKGKSRGTRDYD